MGSSVHAVVREMLYTQVAGCNMMLQAGARWEMCGHHPTPAQSETQHEAASASRTRRARDSSQVKSRRWVGGGFARSFSDVR